MSNLILTPEDGGTWLCDAALETEAFLNAVAGPDLSEGLYDSLGEDETLEWDGDGESEAIIARYLSQREGVAYEQVSRDNVYNHEQDFSDVFTFAVYVPVGTPEWYYAENVYIAPGKHRGGDVRGNYEGPELRRVDSPADVGLLDWNLGWTVDGDAIENSEVESERFTPGYSGNPTYELENAFGNNGVWKAGVYHFHDSDGAPIGVHAEPYFPWA